MKRIIKNIFNTGLSLCGAALLLTSCNDFLDRPPLDQISPNNYFTTAEQLGGFTFN